jgi:hypothetical protein
MDQAEDLQEEDEIQRHPKRPDDFLGCDKHQTR